MELWEFQASSFFFFFFCVATTILCGTLLRLQAMCTPIGCNKVRDVIKELRMWLPRVLVRRVTAPTHQVLVSTLVAAVRTQFLYMEALRAMTVNQCNRRRSMKTSRRARPLLLSS